MLRANLTKAGEPLFRAIEPGLPKMTEAAGRLLGMTAADPGQRLPFSPGTPLSMTGNTPATRKFASGNTVLGGARQARSMHTLMRLPFNGPKEEAFKNYLNIMAQLHPDWEPEGLHGTTRENVDGIEKEGFNPALSGKTWDYKQDGDGMYLTEHPFLAVDYARSASMLQTETSEDDESVQLLAVYSKDPSKTKRYIQKTVEVEDIPAKKIQPEGLTGAPEAEFVSVALPALSRNECKAAKMWLAKAMQQYEESKSKGKEGE